MTQTMNAAGLQLVKDFEECRLKSYKPTPNDVWTIGWGRTQGVKEGDTCTQAEADQWLEDDLRSAEACVSDCVHIPITDNEFSACVSLAYNIGCDAFENSTLVHLLNLADYDGAQKQFARWCKQKGKVLGGLVRRRASEAALFEEA